MVEHRWAAWWCVRELCTEQVNRLLHLLDSVALHGQLALAHRHLLFQLQDPVPTPDAEVLGRHSVLFQPCMLFRRSLGRRHGGELDLPATSTGGAVPLGELPVAKGR